MSVNDVEKTSAWTDAERARSNELTVPAATEQPELPPWLAALHPGAVFTANGWECIVRHVGYEGGLWMMLVEPQQAAPQRSASRSEFRRLRAQIGKKEAKRITKSERAES